MKKRKGLRIKKNRRKWAGKADSEASQETARGEGDLPEWENGRTLHIIELFWAPEI